MTPKQDLLCNEVTHAKILIQKTRMKFCPFHGWKLKKAKNGDWLYCPYRKEFCDVAWERESYGQNLEGRLADNILLEGLCVGG